jgi:hypothetical protein
MTNLNSYSDDLKRGNLLHKCSQIIPNIMWPNEDMHSSYRIYMAIDTLHTSTNTDKTTGEKHTPSPSIAQISNVGLQNLIKCNNLRPFQPGHAKSTCRQMRVTLTFANKQVTRCCPIIPIYQMRDATYNKNSRENKSGFIFICLFYLPANYT